MNHRRLRLTFAGLLIAALATLVAGCDRAEDDDAPRRADYPATHADYGQAISNGKLAASVGARRWAALAVAALDQPQALPLPYQETVVLTADRPRADAWAFNVVAGQALSIALETRANFSGALYVDLFARKPMGGQPAQPNQLGQSERGSEGDAGFTTDRLSSAALLPLASTAATSGDAAQAAETSPATRTMTLTHEASGEQTLIVRVQGELLAEGAYSLTARATPTLAFPVQDVGDGAVRSFWGDARDGGRRSHQGIDIFAPRGTPVLAADSGRISRVGNSKLGGVHVWQRGLGKSFYYAHLDAALVAGGETVEAGQPIGLVGNTGNARTTPPHLHFGVYRWLGGAIDPWPYVARQDAPEPAEIPKPRWVRVNTDNLNFRAGPGTRHTSLRQLRVGQIARVTGATGPWLRVALPDGAAGYVFARLTRDAGKPLSTLVIGQPAELRARADQNSPTLAPLAGGSAVAVLGTDPAGNRVRTQSGLEGWVSLTPRG